MGQFSHTLAGVHNLRATLLHLFNNIAYLYSARLGTAARFVAALLDHIQFVIDSFQSQAGLLYGVIQRMHSLALIANFCAALRTDSGIVIGGIRRMMSCLRDVRQNARRRSNKVDRLRLIAPTSSSRELLNEIVRSCARAAWLICSAN